MPDEPLVKVVVDSSAPDPEALQAQLTEQIEATVAAVQAGTIDAATAAARFQELADRSAAAGGLPSPIRIVPLTAEEIAQREADTAEHAVEVGARAQLAMGGLTAKRDRWLAQTDVFALDPSNLPTDMPQATKDALAANRPAWLTFRQQLRDYPATVTDPSNPPPFPTQPAAPRVIFT